MSQQTVPHRTALASLLAALAMFGPFCIDAIFPAFPAIAQQFGASALAMQQTISVYLFAYAGLSLFVGAFSDAWGRRVVILGGLIVFLVATIGCALAQSMPVLLTFRALQGMSAGVGLIVGRAIVRDCFEGHLAQKLMAQISMIFGVAPALAPVVGAFLVAWGGWHALFWALALFTAALIVLCLIVLPETHPPERRMAFSARNLLTSYRHIVGDRQFVALAFALTFNSAGFFLYIVCAPTFILSILRLDQNHFPWLFVPAISGLVLGAVLTGRLAGRVTTRVLVGSGYLVILLAAALNVLIAWTVQPARVPWAVLPIALAAIGVNLVAPTLNLLVLDRFPRYRGGASSVQAFVMLVFSALLAGVFGPIIATDALHLALASGALYLCGFAGWRWYRAIAKRIPDVVDPDAAVIAATGSSGD
jgi:DHA1 family bicyclomycin/chloramphenicol resistance-like MFS transporter